MQGVSPKIRKSYRSATRDAGTAGKELPAAIAACKAMRWLHAPACSQMPRVSPKERLKRTVCNRWPGALLAPVNHRDAGLAAARAGGHVQTTAVFLGRGNGASFGSVCHEVGLQAHAVDFVLVELHHVLRRIGRLESEGATLALIARSGEGHLRLGTGIRRNP